MQKEEAHAGSVERHYKNGGTIFKGRAAEGAGACAGDADGAGAGDFGDGNQCRLFGLHEGIGDLKGEIAL